MNKILGHGVLMCMVGVLLCCSTPSEKKTVESYNSPEPYETGYIKVSDTHELYYQLGGNPEGIPVMVLHGGPGGSCYPGMLKNFNLDVFHVVLHDQRGAGKSRPQNELKDNNTWTLVEDIETLRKHFNLGKVILFGGSWGSTLALAYAETYPENVSGIVLRGIFTGTQEEIDHFYHGGTQDHFPKLFEQLQSYIDNPDSKNYPEQLYEKLINGDTQTKQAVAEMWLRYEGRMVHLDMDDKSFEKVFQQWKSEAYTFALMENYYMANGCFLKEEQLWNNLNKISHIPVEIVHGRFDPICLLKVAYNLNKQLPESQLTIAEASCHSASEPNIVKGLKSAMKRFEGK